MASRFRSRQTQNDLPGMTNARLQNGAISLRRSYLASGARMSHFKDDSTSRHGIWSALDTATYERNEQAIANAPMGTYIGVFGSNGELIPGGIIEKDGRALRANMEGKIRIYDGKAGAIRRKIVEEQEELIDRAVRECLVSDQACQEVLGWTPEFYEEVMAKGYKPAAGKSEFHKMMVSWGIPDDIWEADARIRRLRLYDENSIQAREGLGKLRAICGAVMPYIDGDTGTSEEALKEQRVVPDE